MKLIETALADVKIIEPRLFGDARGFFMETWNAQAFASVGIDYTFVQDNHSRSAKGVLRGLHYQIKQAQGKLIRITAGAAFDVAVDMRRSSPTFGRWTGTVLSAENNRMLWVPPGFAHGFLSLEDGTDLMYKCTDFFAPEHERAVIWNDPDLGIEWPLDRVGALTLSSKDSKAGRLADVETYP